MEKLRINTSKHVEYIEITKKIEEIVKKHVWDDGILCIFTPHTTAGITINENADPDVRDDIIRGLKEMIPNINYVHSEGNSDAHIKSTLTGVSLNLIVEGGSLIRGTWQGIYFCEYDGPRERELYLKFVKSGR